jgi:hypothetical protein
MTKVEARMTKEGRMTNVEGKGGSDFGLRASFVIRPSDRQPSFGLLFSGPPKNYREKVGQENRVFFEKNGLRISSICENRENKRKTTMVVLEKGNMAMGNTTERNAEGRSSNDERRSNDEGRRERCFGFRTLGFFRHSSFDIRHYGSKRWGRQKVAHENFVYFEKNGPFRVLDL